MGYSMIPALLRQIVKYGKVLCRNATGFFLCSFIEVKKRGNTEILA